MFCAQDYGIATGQKLQVAAKKCMGWSCFSVKKSVFGHRMLLKSKKHLDDHKKPAVAKGNRDSIYCKRPI